MKNSIGLLFSLVLIISCSTNNSDLNKKISEFSQVTSEILERKIDNFARNSAINPNRYKNLYSDFLKYHKQSKIVEKGLDPRLKQNNINLAQAFDSLIIITNEIYSQHVDTTHINGESFTEYSDFEKLAKPIKTLITSVKPNDYQTIGLMLDRINNEVIDFLNSKAKAGLYYFTNVKGPIMIEKDDVIEFHLTSIDSTIISNLLIGSIKKNGLGYQFKEEPEKIRISGFKTVVEKSLIVRKDIFFEMIAPDGGKLMFELNKVL